MTDDQRAMVWSCSQAIASIMQQGGQPVCVVGIVPTDPPLYDVCVMDWGSESPRDMETILRAALEARQRQNREMAERQ